MIDRIDSEVWGVVIVAAGAGTRFGSEIPKQFTYLAGKPVINYSIEAFFSLVDFLVVVTPKADSWKQFWQPSGVIECIPGGKRRQDSVMNGLNNLLSKGVTHVLIHDGARPLVDSGCIKRVKNSVKEKIAVIPVISVSDTVKKVKNGLVLNTVNRDVLRLSQTPQGFYLDTLVNVLATADDITDEASAYEASGLDVVTVKGQRKNIKLTNREDARVLSAFIDEPCRVLATGLDFHPFSSERPLFFCGCKLSENGGLFGHSDGDVVLHAVADAILAASRLGDIGSFFPPSDPKWKGADSSKLLLFCVKKVREAGWNISRLDVTVIGEKPKITPIRSKLISRLAEITDISEEKIWIKGTTTNTIGELAQGKGVACSVLAELIRSD